MTIPAPEMSDEEWGAVGRCDHCDQQRPVRWTGDPYVADLAPDEENPASSWCEACHTRRWEET